MLDFGKLFGGEQPIQQRHFGCKWLIYNHRKHCVGQLSANPISGGKLCDMKKSERDQQLDALFDRLEQIDVEDREVIRPRSANDPAILSEAQLIAYGKRADERRGLIEKVRVLAGESIEQG